MLPSVIDELDDDGFLGDVEHGLVGQVTDEDARVAQAKPVSIGVIQTYLLVLFLDTWRLKVPVR